MSTVRGGRQPEGDAESPKVSWSRLERVVDAWLDRGGGVRSGRIEAGEVLDELCADDSVLRQEVERLIRGGGLGPDVLDTGLSSLGELLAEVEDEIRELEDGAFLGRTIDRYRLREVLGTGGMGVVYRAERADDQFDHQVALKVMPRGLETPEKERRFLTERQILARLEHESIARLLDGGLTEEGFPYLVMELVDGLPIDRYCEQNELDTGARVRLVIEACRAVHFAHQNLVVHRDLKPSNILVSRRDGEDGVRVKLLDFGIAKMLDDAGELTRTHVQPMTPAFAAPEQHEGGTVSTATDVYALGAMLRRLLVANGRPDGDPPVDPGVGDLGVPGDLGVIIAKATRRTPESRYGSAKELADDLVRWLEARPIAARPRSWRYRLGRAVARHRVVAAVTAAMALVAVLGAVSIVWQARVAALERDRAHAQAEKARQVSQVLSSLFQGASPYAPEAGELSALELLEQGEWAVAERLVGQPAVRGNVLSVIAGAYASSGRPSRALELARKAVADLRAADPADERGLAEALRVLATASRAAGNVEAASPFLEEALHTLERIGATETPVAADVHRGIGITETALGNYEVAARHHRRAIAIFEELGQESEAATARIQLASSLEGLGELERALGLKQEGLEVLRRTYGNEHPSVTGTLNNIAVSLRALGRHEESLPILREALELDERLLGEDHPGFSDKASNLGRLLMDLGRFEEAEEHLSRAVRLQSARERPDDMGRIAAELNLASLEVAMGRFGSAIERYRDGLERLERRTGEGSLASARVRSLLGRALHRRGETDEAERLLQVAMDRQRDDPDVGNLAETLVFLGALHSDLARDEQAITLLREALELRRSVLDENHWRVAEARIELALALLRSVARAPAERDTARPEALALLERLQDLNLDDTGRRWQRRRLLEARRLAGIAALP